MTKQLSDHLESARILLNEIPFALSTLQEEYKECITKLAVSPKFRTQTQAFLGHLRSILDFLSHEMSCFCSRPPRRIYFPIAKTGMSKVDFKKNLRKNWLPGIDVNHPDIFDYLIKLQYFYPGNDWLPAFHELSNKNKHVKLSRMEIAGCGAALIRFNGKPVMQIGDRGYQSLTIKEGGSLVFQAGSRRAAIHGSQTIDRNTEKFLHVDPGLDIVPAMWSEFKFNEFPQQPAIVFLEAAEREVRRISKQIEELIQNGRGSIAQQGQFSRRKKPRG
ncbi:MAG: hypothetical protein JRF31_03850 [Deltaproteobacteria bacterium]|nr:hypothetical protein [Deltaproteobacteria bacterium]